MKTDYTNIIFVEKELVEFYRHNKRGKGSGFGRRVIELYAYKKCQKAEAQRDKLLKALNLSQQWIIKMNNCLPKSELKDILSAGIKSNEKAIKSITKSDD